MKIPLVDLHKQYKSIKKEIISAIVEVLESKKFIQGEYAEKFASEFAEVHGIDYAVGCSNGTSAISILLKAAGVGHGDEVITTPHTFIATVEAIISVGARPVFVDVDRETYNIDVKQIKKAITRKTRAILPVHIYGNPCDMDLMSDIAREKGLLIIEDCAQAHLAKFNGKPVGTFGIGGTFSFYPGKNLGAYGDAGAIVSNSVDIIARCKSLLDHGRIDKYTHKIVGENARMDGIQAQVLRVKLGKIITWTKARQKRAKMYTQLLKNIPGVVLPVSRPEAEHVYHLYVIRVRNRDKVREALKSKDIESGIHYPIPLHLQPALRYLGYCKGEFPVCEEISNDILSLPMYAELTRHDIECIVNVIRKSI
jgi:dTDP-4-amino-4,6-dideoxygalactose transaminase